MVTVFVVSHFRELIAFLMYNCAAEGSDEMRSVSLWSVLPAIRTFWNMEPALCMLAQGSVPFYCSDLAFVVIAMRVFSDSNFDYVYLE